MAPRRRNTSRLMRGALAGMAVVIGSAGAAVAAPSAPVATHRVPRVLVGLSHLTLLGPAPSSARQTVGVFLQRPDPAGEQQFYTALYDPASPEYHQFLTPAQFDQRFGVPSGQVSAVASWLSRDGLSVDGGTGATGYVTATGTVAQLEKTFAVTLERYRAGATTFVANATEPSVPVSLPILSVVGLDTLHRFTPASAYPGASQPAGSSAVGSGFSGVLTPQDLWKIYDQPAGDLGQGQTVGVFGEGQTSSVIDNLRLFEQHFGFPKVPVRVVHTEKGSAAAYGDNSGNIEWYLDTQASTGMAPDVRQLDLYFSKSLFDADVFASLANWVHDPQGPRQMNASFGECETNPLNPVLGPLAQVPYGTEMGDDLEPMVDAQQITRQAAIEGRTLFSSAGDTGSGCPELVVPVAGAGNGVAIQPVPEVNYPAADPYVVGVGGTVITTAANDHGSRQSEVSWTFTGGGTSWFIPEPFFQKGVAAVDHSCLTDPTGKPYPTPTTCRGVPDVAALSGNVTGNGYFIYIDGNQSSEGGTSLSSPLTMGMWARIQSAAPGPKGLGFADPALYRAAKVSGGRDFYDVTSAETPLGNGAYQPGPGWDYTSGLGAFDVSRLVATLDGAQAHAAGGAGASQSPARVCSASLSSPAGNATDPVDSAGNDPGLDLTGASLSTSPDGRTVVATFTGPAVTSAAPPDATAGRDLYLLWSYKGVEYFADVHFDSTGSPSYTSGSSVNGQYTPSATTKATGKVSGDTVTVSVPASEVGSPPAGALLSYPFALSQLDAGTPNAAGSPSAYLSMVADTAATPVGHPASPGVAVVVGRCA